MIFLQQRFLLRVVDETQIGFRCVDIGWWRLWFIYYPPILKFISIIVLIIINHIITTCSEDIINYTSHDLAKVNIGLWSMIKYRFKLLDVSVKAHGNKKLKMNSNYVCRTFIRFPNYCIKKTNSSYRNGNMTLYLSTFFLCYTSFLSAYVKKWSAYFFGVSTFFYQ